MTEQPPSAEALELVSRLRQHWLSEAFSPASYWHELNLLDAGKAIDALIAQRVSAALAEHDKAALEVVRAAKAHEDAAVTAETERCAIVALEQRCQRTFSRPTMVSYAAGDRTPWDLACTTIADKIRAPSQSRGRLTCHPADQTSSTSPVSSSTKLNARG
jgi:hypothetical protein